MADGWPALEMSINLEFCVNLLRKLSRVIRHVTTLSINVLYAENNVVQSISLPPVALCWASVPSHYRLTQCDTDLHRQVVFEINTKSQNGNK
jgi:hypothetical protein